MAPSTPVTQRRREKIATDADVTRRYSRNSTKETSQARITEEGWEDIILLDLLKGADDRFRVNHFLAVFGLHWRDKAT